MDFTGERFIPGLNGNIEIEHLHRYYQALEIVHKKTVVDIACGEGYGSSLLADAADKVIGIDIDKSVIEHASSTYQKNNLEYITGSCAAIPLPDKSIDIVISFETIEHHDQHEKMLSEIRRILKPDGVLLISSPDKYEYSDRYNYQNPYHVKELYENDFKNLLNNTFKKTTYYGQKIFYGSGIFSENKKTQNLFLGKKNNAISKTTGIRSPLYWIALASDSDLPHFPSGIFEEPINDTEIIQAWKKTVQQRDTEISSLKEKLTDKKNKIVNLKNEVSKLTKDLVEIKNSTSWKMTLPIRHLGTFLKKNHQKSIKNIITSSKKHCRNLVPTHYKKRIKNFTDIILSHIKRHNAVNSYKASLQNIKKQPQTNEKPDYFFWGVIDWNFRNQRPQQIAKALAATGRRVFYISSEIIQSSQNGCHIESLDDSGMLFQIKLFTTDKAPVIYASSPNLSTLKNLKKSLSHVLNWSESQTVISVIHHPFWVDVALSLPNSRQIYDCMDYHDGFGNNHASLIKSEEYLIAHADATIVTSTWLKDRIGPHAKHCVIIRNACEYNFFSKKPEKIFHAPRVQSIIGYYGAIAEWFDIDLLEVIAKKFSDAYILLIGNDTCGASNKLKLLPNVHFTGEVSYQELPYYLHSFDVCLLPFKILPLTLATNPVKIYEYMSAGKPIVAVDLPEIQEFNNLVYCAKNTDQFLKMIESALSKQNIQDIDARKKFASEQTWLHRCQAFIHEAESASRDPLVSIIVVTYNNIDFTKDCLFSIEQHSQYQKLEIIVVDNASSDTTPDFLRKWQHKESEFTKKIILNSDNKGFAAANNQGLSIAEGQYLTLLNNDTYVTPGWIRTLLSHLKADKTIGLIGPVTNNIGNQAKINIQYPDIKTMLEISAHHTRNHIGERFQLKTAAFFCVMMPRHVYELIGPLDEAFGLGFFEDDDYCRRIEQKGLRIMCAEDVFIHHHLSASFDKIKQTHRQALFEKNKTIYEKKWGTWIPHSYKRDE